MVGKVTVVKSRSVCVVAVTMASAIMGLVSAIWVGQVTSVKLRIVLMSVSIEAVVSLEYVNALLGTEESIVKRDM